MDDYIVERKGEGKYIPPSAQASAPNAENGGPRPRTFIPRSYTPLSITPENVHEVIGDKKDKKKDKHRK